MIGIYAIRQPVTGRCYIGSSVGIDLRFRQHRKSLDAGTHHNVFLQRAWTKHGADAFLFEVVETCERERLPEREQFHLDQQTDPFNIGTDTRVPWRGQPRSQEHRDRLAASHRGKRQPHTPEQRRKIVEANKRRAGEKHSEETLIKMRKPRGPRRVPVSAETRAKYSAVAKRRTYSPETRAKMSVSAKRRARTMTFERQSAIMKGRIWSAETIAKRAISLKAAWARRPERRIVSAEVRAKLTAGQRRRRASEAAAREAQ